MKNENVSELIKIDLSDIINTDLEGFLDLIAEFAGYPYLKEINYSIEGHEGDTLQIRVKGYVRKPKGIDRFFTPEEIEDANRAFKKGTTGPISL
ncbi:hypothetical protein LCGC14_1281310 [marine sediment metagenome]|uniref:Uncharacterized protein n=1 Tax=marine sediment metagenome TaxID=412755 RepID=A0A0F9KV38_9ZZZZ